MAKRSAVRNVLMHGFHLLVMVVVGNQIRDTQCGFKVRARLRAHGSGQGAPPGAVLRSMALAAASVKLARRPTSCLHPAPGLPPQLFTRAAAQQIYSNQRLQRWCFDVEDVYLAQRLKVGWGGKSGADG